MATKKKKKTQTATARKSNATRRPGGDSSVKKAGKKSVVRLDASPALGAAFEPEKFESRLYSFWEGSGCFDAHDENAADQESFCIVIPPPNVTGVLHMGHALTNTIQDILTRWRRMKGDNALWLPGTDHAGIATQAQVEKAIAKEKGPNGRPLSRHDLGREKFLERTWQWKDEHHGRITAQLRRLGSSLDWKRERFTMDKGFSQAVREVFVRLYEEELIYRGERIINWCPRCQTALSDLEVVPTDKKGQLYHLRYDIVEDDGTPVKKADGSPESLVIATTRPETLLGDTAVAVHPEDERYRHVHGKKAKLPLLGRLIPVITDEYVDREFGTGGLKVTPAHDFNDYELGRRHNLPFVSVMGKEGKITPAGGPYAGLGFAEAREKIVHDLKVQGLLLKTEDHPMKVGLCQRCSCVAEPVISKQWFVKIEPLAKPAIEAVETGRIQFSPKSWEKTYFEWMYNIRDWCISRQLWWGHQIPAWYCGRCQGVTVARETPEKCGECGTDASQLRQDEDVLDTWFSSALWPFGTLGWPEKTKALATFYPTSILETGFDIIFFWVARMIMMGIHFMDEVPFHKVYLHAMVRDEKGEKMSKSKGNVIDPLETIDQYGADPLRFTLAVMAGQGRDVKLSMDRVAGYRAFCNKLWNAVKFFHLMYQSRTEGGPVEEPPGGAEAWLHLHRAELLPANGWILSELQKVIAKVEHGLANFELNVSSQALYDFTWGEFCDWYVEFSKLPLREEGANREQTLVTLHYVIETLLKLLHPFVPFVTEELWQSLPWKRAAERADRPKAIETIMLQPFPEPYPDFANAEAEKSIGTLKSIIEALRNFRGENRIPPSKEFEVRYVSNLPAADLFVKMNRGEIMSLVRISGLEKVSADAARGSGGQEAVIPLTNPPLELRINMEGLVDTGEEVARLKKEIEKVGGDIDHVRRKLSNQNFIARAPQELVEKEKSKERELVAKLTELEGALNRLSHASKTPSH